MAAAGGHGVSKIKMKGFRVLGPFNFNCKCVDTTQHHVMIPMSDKTVTEVCLQYESNYDRALFYEEAVIPCFKDYKDDITRKQNQAGVRPLGFALV